MNSLNPVMRVKDQIADAIETHEGRQPAGVLKERILHLLETVRLPGRVYNLYPHELSGGMKQRLGVAMLLIGHDMALQAQMVDRIAVMYAGNIVELAPVKEIFADPLHPYTRRLIASIPTTRERTLLSRAARSPGSMDLTLDLRTPRPSPPLRELKPDHFVAPSIGSG